MRRWFALACVIGGCWRGEPPIAPSPEPDPSPVEPMREVARLPEPGSFEEAMVKMSEFRDKMCGCSDKTCADAVTDEMTKWSVEIANRPDSHYRDMRPSEEQTRQITSVMQDFSKCMTSAMTAGSSLSNP